MGKNSKIAWTDHTFNPWWGCTRVSAGCEHCYAAGMAKRLGYDVWDNGLRRLFGNKHWQEPLAWNASAAAAGQRHRVFSGSMCDVCEATGSAELDVPRERLWDLIDQTPNLDWVLVTKRPENMPTLAPSAWSTGWPKNVWAIATVENQAVAFSRILSLLRVPSVVRGLSIEPMLGPVDLRNFRFDVDSVSTRWDSLTVLDWIIVGGESGPNARPMHPEWVRSLRDQCQEAGVPFFFKQWGPVAAGRTLDGHEYTDVPVLMSRIEKTAEETERESK